MRRHRAELIQHRPPLPLREHVGSRPGVRWLPRSGQRPACLYVLMCLTCWLDGRRSITTAVPTEGATGWPLVTLGPRLSAAEEARISRKDVIDIHARYTWANVILPMPATLNVSKLAATAAKLIPPSFGPRPGSACAHWQRWARRAGSMRSPTAIRLPSIRVKQDENLRFSNDFPCVQP
jgi:hypothetical protein